MIGVMFYLYFDWRKMFNFELESIEGTSGIDTNFHSWGNRRIGRITLDIENDSPANIKKIRQSIIDGFSDKGLPINLRRMG